MDMDEFVTVAASERPGAKRRFTDAQFLAAVAEFGGDNNSIAKRLRCSTGCVHHHRRRHGLSNPDGANRLKFSDAALLDAIARHGDDDAAIVAELNCSLSRLNFRRRALGVPTPNPGGTSVVRVMWTMANRTKLAEAVMQSPRPSVDELVTMFGATAGAIRTALSRHGLTKFDAPHTHRRAADLSVYVRRHCMCCGQLFASEGSHNRLCRGFKAEDNASCAA